MIFILGLEDQTRINIIWSNVKDRIVKIGSISAEFYAFLLKTFFNYLYHKLGTILFISEVTSKSYKLPYDSYYFFYDYSSVLFWFLKNI